MAWSPTVNHKPILLSDWDEAVCYETVHAAEIADAVTDADRATALQRLIDRQLLKAQMISAHSLEPSDDELQNDLAKLRSQVPEGKDDGAGRSCWPATASTASC